MTDETIAQNAPAARTADHTQPEKPRRRKKAPSIDFDDLTERERVCMRSVAETGAQIGRRQDQARRAQLAAMKDTLADILADPDGVEPSFVRMFFEVMLENASAPNARKIAAHRLCPPNLADAHGRRTR